SPAASGFSPLPLPAALPISGYLLIMLDSYRDLIDGLLVTPNALRDALGTPVPADLAPEKTRLLRELRVREAINLRRIQAIMRQRSEEHTSELQSRENLVCRL